MHTECRISRKSIRPIPCVPLLLTLVVQDITGGYITIHINYVRSGFCTASAVKLTLPSVICTTQLFVIDMSIVLVLLIENKASYPGAVMEANNVQKLRREDEFGAEYELLTVSSLFQPIGSHGEDESGDKIALDHGVRTSSPVALLFRLSSSDNHDVVTGAAASVPSIAACLRSAHSEST
jgi:hypothetical protein